MILVVMDDERKESMFEIEGVDEAPYGIEQTDDGGFALSASLRLELTRFFYDGTVLKVGRPKRPENVVQFPQRDFRGGVK